MRVEIDKELKAVRIDVGDFKFDDQRIQEYFEDSLRSVEELIRVLNFEYVPLYQVKQVYDSNQLGMKAYQDLPRQQKAIKAGVDANDHEEMSQGFRLLANLHDTFDNQTRGMSREELVRELRTLYSNNYAGKMKEMERVGGCMKFANPIVWMMYKYFAYENGIMGAKPIRTLGDLIDHCASDTYICTKRFHYINKWLEDYGYRSLRDGLKHGPETDLVEIFTDLRFISIAMKEELMETWNENERIGMDDTKKWEDYKEHLPEDGRLASVAENRPGGFKLSFGR